MIRSARRALSPLVFACLLAFAAALTLPGFAVTALAEADAAGTKAASGHAAGPETKTAAAPEAPASAASTSAEPRFELAMVATSGFAWNAIRYDILSGKSWVLEEGNWRAIAESGEVPTARYEVRMVALSDDWGAMRIDLRSGRAWHATPAGWSEVQEKP